MEKDQQDVNSIINEIKQSRVPYGSLSFWFLGQAGVVLKGNGIVLYIDPYLSEYLENRVGLIRNYSPPILPGEVKDIDYYLISHDHLDHFDPGTVEVVAEQNPGTYFIAPAFCHRQLGQLGVKEDQIIDAWTDTWINQGELKIRPIPSAHETLEEDDQLGHRFVGYILQLNGVTVYHAGDTVIYPELLERLKAIKVNVGMLPINGHDFFRFERGNVGNMNYKEAAELAYTTDFDLVIPLHYDMFADNSERPGNFVDYIYGHFPEQRFHVFSRKEQFIYVQQNSWTT